MTVVCPGWAEPRHPELVIKTDPADPRVSHGMCADCQVALGVAPDPKVAQYLANRELHERVDRHEAGELV